MLDQTGHGEMSGRLSNEEVVRLGEHVAGLTASGLPLAPGLRATAEELPAGRLRSVLNDIADALDRGESVEAAVAAQGRRLPEHLRGLVVVGARTGRMGQVLGRFVEFVNVGIDLNRRLTISLAYPVISLVCAGAVFTFICTAIVGAFEQIFKDFGIPLPKLTIALLNIARVFNQGGVLLGETLIGLVIFALVARFVLGRATRRSMLSGTPVLGAVWKNTSLAEFCHLLALMLDCELPLAEALRLTGDGVPDASVGRACTAMRLDVERGMRLSEAVARQPFFPRGLNRVLGWAEGNGSLPGSLQMVGEMFEVRARAQASFAGTVLGVITIISILFGVAVIVLGLFLPLITLISRLSG
jgi:type II secretory pathway component PulF